VLAHGPSCSLGVRELRDIRVKTIPARMSIRGHQSRKNRLKEKDTISKEKINNKEPSPKKQSVGTM
jgi:hypothetical protein